MVLQSAAMDMGNMLPRRRQRFMPGASTGTEHAKNEEIAQRPMTGMLHIWYDSVSLASWFIY